MEAFDVVVVFSVRLDVYMSISSGNIQNSCGDLLK